jgi:hypothetical protein
MGGMTEQLDTRRKRSAALSMRIAPATRNQLLAIAEKNGRSVTQEADRLLQRAIWAETVHYGGPEMARMVFSLATAFAQGAIVARQLQQEKLAQAAEAAEAAGTDPQQAMAGAAARYDPEGWIAGDPGAVGIGTSAAGGPAAYRAAMGHVITMLMAQFSGVDQPEFAALEAIAETLKKRLPQPEKGEVKWAT